MGIFGRNHEPGTNLLRLPSIVHVSPAIGREINEQLGIAQGREEVQTRRIVGVTNVTNVGLYGASSILTVRAMLLQMHPDGEEIFGADCQPRCQRHCAGRRRDAEGVGRWTSSPYFSR